MHLKMSSAKQRQFCLDRNVFNTIMIGVGNKSDFEIMKAPNSSLEHTHVLRKTDSITTKPILGKHIRHLLKELLTDC